MSILSLFTLNTNNHKYPLITKKLIHEKFVFIHGHSCFLQKIIRRAKPHAATPFVKFAKFADKRTLHVDLLKRRTDGAARAKMCLHNLCRVVTDEGKANYPNETNFFHALFCVILRKTGKPVCAPGEGATIGTRGFRTFLRPYRAEFGGLLSLY